MLNTSQNQRTPDSEGKMRYWYAHVLVSPVPLLFNSPGLLDAVMRVAPD
jgi:hypothetical protein